MAQSGFIVQIAKSRNNILDILLSRGFDVSKYANAALSEVHTMYQNDQLDMLVEEEATGKKVYVKYSLGKTLRAPAIYEYIEDLFTLDSTLKKSDDLIVIGRASANDSMIKALRQIWADDKYFVTVIGMESLQFNVLEHSLVPRHEVLDSASAEKVFARYNIRDGSQVPDLSRFGPVSMVLGIRPGELCEITRPSKTATTSKFYRICSQ
jgi:DNA-directed RNA polymerase subunit H (RpoH/RPB5)